MAELDLALVFTPDDWVEELHRHLADHGGARVLHLVVDPAMALHERFDVLVVSWRWPALTPGLVADLQAQGRAVLGVADRDERGAVDVLSACAVDAVVYSDAAPWDYVDALATIEASRPPRPPRSPHGSPFAASVDDTNLLPRRPHPWIAVCGPGGAGRTEIALELARALDAVLVDADEVAPAIAARLGLALEPNVCNAVDAVEFGAADVVTTVQLAEGLPRGVVCGVPNPSAWAQIRPPELLRVVHAVSRATPVVLDTSSPIDDIGSASRSRYAVTRAIVAEADVIVAVGLASPVGVVRLLGWLADAQRLRPAVPVHVVLNRSTSTLFRRAELTAEVLRSFEPRGLTHVPDDERVRAAGWHGAVVARGPFTKAVAAVAAHVGQPRVEAVAS